MSRALEARLFRRRKLCVQRKKDVKHQYDSVECEEGLMGNEVEQVGSDQLLKDHGKYYNLNFIL